MAPFGPPRALRRRRAACGTARALRRGGPLPLARDQRSLRHGLPRSPGGRLARGRRPHRRRARPVVADGVTGLLTPIGDAAALRCGRARLLKDPAERARLWRRCRRAGCRASRRARRGTCPGVGAGDSCRTAAMRRSALRPPASCPHRLEWRKAGYRASPTPCLSPEGESAARHWRSPPPADGWKRLSSPLQRARRTAELVQPSMPVAIDSSLREMSFGIWEGF